MILTPRTPPTALRARACAGRKTASGIFWRTRENRARKTCVKPLKPRQVAEVAVTKTASGVCYYGFRYYNPSTGRWLSKDPIGERGGLNLYGMVDNDPLNNWDYLGLKTCTTIIYVGHYGQPDSKHKPGECDRGVLATCMRDSTNETYGKNTGRGVPDHGGKRNGGWIFPNPDGDYKNHPSYDEKRGDTTVQDAFNSELANAEAEAKLTQCKNCCTKVEIRVRSLDADGAAWMKRSPNFYNEGSIVKTVYCNR